MPLLLIAKRSREWGYFLLTAVRKEKMVLIGTRKGTLGIAGKVWPDGSFGYSFLKVKKNEVIKKVDACEQARRTVEIQLHKLRQADLLLAKASVRFGVYLPLLLVKSLPTAERVSLGLSEAVNYHKKQKRPRGSGGITSRGRRSVRSAGTLLEFRFGKDRLSFATLTMPGLTDVDRQACHEQWSEAVRAFYQELKRHVERKGGSWWYVGVVEIQPLRSEREGWAAPHLHFVFVGKKGKTWLITPKQMRTLWQRVWQPRFSSSYDWQSCENLVRVKASVAGYLAKYLSKGSTSQSSSKGMDSWFPSSWVSLSQKLKGWLSKACVSAESISPMLLDSSLQQSFFSRVGEKPVTVTLSTGHEIVVGVTGYFPSKEWLEFLGAFYPDKLAPG